MSDFRQPSVPHRAEKGDAPPSDARAARFALLAVAVVFALALAALLVESTALQALQRAAGYEIGDNNAFRGVYSFLSNLRDGIGPLAIPAGAIGIAAAGFAYMAGSSVAQRVGMGVVIGMLLVLTGPSIIQ
jgi:hypothetical protein